MIEFAAFAPDRSAFDPSVTNYVRNVIPRPTSYGPFPAKVTVGDALPGRPRGAFLARTSAGVYQTFAWTEDAAYKFNGTDKDWDDVTKTATTYAVPTEGAWSVRQFGNYVVAVNGVDNPQYYDLSSSSLFDDLAGSPPVGTHAAVVGDFLVFGNTDAYGPRSVAWSGLNDAEAWTVGSQASDYQVFPEGGEILGIAGFDGGAVIFQDNVIREMVFDPASQYVFQFRKTDETRTIVAPRSIVRAGGGIFFLTLEGFFRYGQPSVPIGDERIDRWFRDDVNIDQIWQTQGAADPVNKIVYWRYSSVNHARTDTTDRVLIYNYAVDRWSVADVELSWIFPATSPGETLESLDALGFTLDTFPTSFDSRIFAGGTPLIAGFDENYKLVFFSGTPLEAVIQTGDVSLNGMRRAFVNGFRPISDAEDVSGRVAIKDRHGDALAWKAEASINRTGIIPCRANGRLHRFEITIPAEEAWNHAHGVDVPAVPGGDQ